MIFVFALLLFFHRKEWRKSIVSPGSVKIGFLIGLTAFLGGYSILTALTMGPFSLITAIHSLYIFPTAIAGVLMFKEKMTPGRWLLLGLAVLATLLIRFG
jgi:uncharacterized membrane protein